MDQFVKGKRKAIDEVAQTQAGAVHLKAKCRKYDGAYAFLLSASLTGRTARTATALHWTWQSDSCKSF